MGGDFEDKIDFFIKFLSTFFCYIHLFPNFVISKSKNIKNPIFFTPRNQRNAL